MADTFHVFASAVRAQFESLAKGKLFTVNTDRDAIWERYLAAFPEGSNPLFRKKTEHDCSCCRHFIRAVGNVVAIKGSALVTVWDAPGLESPYKEVAAAMADYVRSCAVDSVFLTPYGTFGQDKTPELIDGRVHQWRHFSVTVPVELVRKRDYAEKRGEARTAQATLLRGLRELQPAALETVRELIKANALYRGAEHARSVENFAKLQAAFRKINDPVAQELFAWENSGDRAGAGFRNSVIGTLVQDLSEGADVETAVAVFESKVAPQNYKRTTALVTKSMVDNAMKTVDELGIEDALERRHARFEDVSIDAVLFVDNAVAGRMKGGGVRDLLMESVKPASFDPKNVQPIAIDAFIADVLPKVRSLELYAENSHLGHFMSLTAPVHADAKPLFMWDNPFAWSYDGNVTDSIREKVKKAGGRVENNKLRVSLAWHNYDDLDLHCIEPNGTHIYFANKNFKLDVDMNAGTGSTRSPVENIRWVDRLGDGVYKVYVHQFNLRERTNVGFEVELEFDGAVHHFRYPGALRNKEQQAVVSITVKGGRVTQVTPAAGIEGGALAQEKWGVTTNTLVRVNSLIVSPNYWGDNTVGNKHWFFILEGCNNPQPTRGIYNEFLGGELQKHRKVFELLGEKTKCPPAPQQMSGLGFSSTLPAAVTVRAMGPGLRTTYEVMFGV